MSVCLFVFIYDLCCFISKGYEQLEAGSLFYRETMTKKQEQSKCKASIT